MGDNNYFPQNHQQPDYRQNHYGQQGNQQADYGQQGSQYGQYQPPQYQQTSYQQQYSLGYNSPGGPSSPFYGFGGHGPDGTPWYKRWWAIVGIAVLVIGAIAGLLFVLLSGDDDDAGGTPTETVEPTEEPTDEISASPTDEPTPASEGAVPDEYEEALETAESQLSHSSFSKASLHRLLTSEYGYGFSTEAADHALENVDVDWNEQAVAMAESYLNVIPFSEEGLFDQMTSEFGGEITDEEAEYGLHSYRRAIRQRRVSGGSFGRVSRRRR